MKNRLASQIEGKNEKEVKMEINIEIPGKPQAKQRPFVTKKGIAFTKKETAVYENLVKLAYRQKTDYMFMGAVEIVINILIKPPVTISKKKYQEMIDGKILPQVRPDVDNVAKSITDALNKIAYNDDAQITYLLVKKRYAEKDGVSVYIRENKEMVF